MSDDSTPAIAQPVAYCTTIPRAGDRLTDACPDCGHATVLHIGVDHCPVCELVDLNRRARAETVTHVTVNVADAAIDKALERYERNRRAINRAHAFRR